MMGEVAIVGELLVGLDAEVAQLRHGDPNGLAALVARYQNRLYRFLVRMTREPATAEDLFQLTWLRAAQGIRQYDARRSFEAWLFRVARNLAIDHLRRYRPESLDAPLPSGDTPAALLPAADPGALARLLEHEQAARLAATLEELPAIHREIVTLRFEEEMKLEEIAEVLEIPLSTVKSRLRRALESLRARLEGGVDEGRVQ